MKKNRKKEVGLEAVCPRDGGHTSDTRGALYPKYAFIVPDIFYPDPETAYQGIVDERSALEIIGSYFQALRPYFLQAMEQANQDVAKSTPQKQD